MIFNIQRPVRRLPFAATLLLVIQTAFATPNQDPPIPRLLNSGLSQDGHARIAWDLPEKGTMVELQQAKDEEFANAKTVYRGPDGATFISGLEDGNYYYRLRVANGAWSDPVTLTVKHHSLRLALVLCSLGAVVFALTVLIVVKGTVHASND